MNALVGLLARQGVDGDLEIAGQKTRPQVLGAGIAKFQLDLGVAGASVGDEIEDLVGRDRAHDSQFERPPCHELFGKAPRQSGVIINRLKVRA